MRAPQLPPGGPALVLDLDCADGVGDRVVREAVAARVSEPRNRRDGGIPSRLPLEVAGVFIDCDVASWDGFVAPLAAAVRYMQAAMLRHERIFFSSGSSLSRATSVS